MADFKPEQMPTLTPYLTVEKPETSMDFYSKAFGFESFGDPITQEGAIQHAEMRFGDAVIMMGPEMKEGENAAQPPSVSGTRVPVGLYIYCQDVDTLYQRAIDCGAEISQEPTDMFWGDRMCSLFCPNGYQFSFATKVGEFDASKMNA